MHTYIHISILTNIHTHYTHTYIHTHIHKYIHTCIYTYRHTYRHYWHIHYLNVFIVGFEERQCDETVNGCAWLSRTLTLPEDLA